MNTQEILEQELKNIEDHFKAAKEIYPTVIMIKDDNRFLFPASSQSSVQKDIVSQGIKDLVKKSDPDVVIYFAEAWMAPIRMKQDRLIPISRADDKVEILLVHIEFKTGEKYSRLAHILRNGPEAKLSSFENLGVDLTSGRFMDFFPHTTN
jgi:hypothetical protein